MTDIHTPGADQAAAKAAEPIDFEQANAFANVEALGCYLSEVPNLARAYLAQRQENAELRREKESRAPDRREPCKKCGYWVVRS